MFKYIFFIFLAFMCRCASGSNACGNNNILSGSPDVTGPFVSSLSTIGGDACTTDDLNNVYRGLNNWAQYTYIYQTLHDGCDYECACYSYVGLAIAEASQGNCIKEITDADYDSFLYYLQLYVTLPCDIEEAPTHCGYDFIPIHGGYTEWSIWTTCEPCSSGQYNGTQERTRECTNPEPMNPGSMNCTARVLGDSIDIVSCLCPDGCLSDPCQNGGTCSSNVLIYNCTCPEYHFGIHCENYTEPEVTTATAEQVTEERGSGLYIALGVVGGLLAIGGGVAATIIIIKKKMRPSSRVGAFDDKLGLPEHDENDVGVSISEPPPKFTMTTHK